mgnify:CR=1 FL=1
MTIEDNLKAMTLMSSLAPSWETFVTIVCNASTIVIEYSKVTSATLTEADRTKSLAKKTAIDAYVVQSLATTKQSRKKFFPTVKQSTMSKQVPR